MSFLACVSRPRTLGLRLFSQFASGFSLPAPKQLDQVMPLAELQKETPEEIARLWKDYHLGRTHIGRVLTAQEYEAFSARAQSCPMFVLPVPRTEGFVTMFAQAQIPHVLVTGLEDYKVRGSSAAPFLTITHYPELMHSKGVVLVRGDVVLPNKLKDTEAGVLVDKLHEFFLNDSFYKLVQNFNKNSPDFDFKDVVRAMGLPISW